jgi:Cof subfamily protein (haloacid dehalogenase superfamily)
MKKYLATDLDGTLLFPKVATQYVCEENKFILNNYFKDRAIIVSGRDHCFVKKVCKELNIDETFVCCNGANIFLNGKCIYTEFLDNNVIKEIIDFVKEKYKEYCFVFFDIEGKIYSLSENKERIEKIQQESINRNNLLGYSTIKDDTLVEELLNKSNNIIKMNIAVENKEELHTLLVTKNYKFSYSLCKAALELTKENVNKGNSLKILTNAMNINDDNVIVVGDDKNDISMFENFRNSFIIAHDNNTDIQNKAKYVLEKFSDLKHYVKEE